MSDDASLIFASKDFMTTPIQPGQDDGATITTSAVLVPWDESQPLESLTVATKSISSLIHATDTINVVCTLVIRPTEDEPGLYAHHYSHHITTTTSSCTIGGMDEENLQGPNIRATRLAMACGLFRFRLSGNVFLTRGTLGCTSGGILLLEDVLGACSVSCDLRWVKPLPHWLGNAAHHNYHDALVISRLATVMSRSDQDSDQSDTDVDDSEGDDDQEYNGSLMGSSNNRRSVRMNEMVTTVSLCLHCRKPAAQLCPDCRGAYFCDPPAVCRLQG
jgi:hypothetical protein